jgi:hypothetical protein
VFRSHSIEMKYLRMFSCPSFAKKDLSSFGVSIYILAVIFLVTGRCRIVPMRKVCVVHRTTDMIDEQCVFLEFSLRKEGMRCRIRLNAPGYDNYSRALCRFQRFHCQRAKKVGPVQEMRGKGGLGNSNSMNAMNKRIYIVMMRCGTFVCADLPQPLH